MFGYTSSLLKRETCTQTGNKRGASKRKYQKHTWINIFLFPKMNL